MPIRPYTIIYTCSSCGWSKTVTPKSDALMPGEFFNVCPSCGNEPIERRSETMNQGAAVIRLIQQIKNQWF